MEFLGSKGLLQAQNILENTVVKSTTAGVTGAKPTYFFLERYMPAYRAEWAALVAAVSDGGPLPVTLADGVAALAMAEAATLSVGTGAPVRLKDHFASWYTPTRSLNKVGSDRGRSDSACYQVSL